MNIRNLTGILLVLTVCLCFTGCTQVQQETGMKTSPATTAITAQGTPAEKITTEDLITFVSSARAYARENGKDAALAAFNDPRGKFVRDGLYIFSEGYDGTALAEPLPERNAVGRQQRPMAARAHAGVAGGVGVVHGEEEIHDPLLGPGHPVLAHGLTRDAGVGEHGCGELHARALRLHLGALERAFRDEGNGNAQSEGGLQVMLQFPRERG
jgi:hypothetical protein